MFSYFKHLAIVYRMVTVSGKSSYALTGNSYKGYLKAAGTEQSLYQDKFGQDYYFTTYSNADIKSGDQVTINGEEYKVKGVGKWDGVVLDYKKFILVKVLAG